MSERRGVLITRHPAAAAETAARVAALGFDPVVASLFDVIALAAEYPPPSAIQAVLVTSANAPGALPAALHGVRLLAVGDATAQAARASGFRDVTSAGMDATALATLAAAECDPTTGPLLLASGTGQGAPLLADLRSRGFHVAHRSVYDTRPVSSLPDTARAALAEGWLDAVLFFSPAAARLFVALLEPDVPRSLVMRIDGLAISAATAAACAPLPWRRIRVASRPNQDELLALLT